MTGAVNGKVIARHRTVPKVRGSAQAKTLRLSRAVPPWAGRVLICRLSLQPQGTGIRVDAYARVSVGGAEKEVRSSDHPSPNSPPFCRLEPPASWTGDTHRVIFCRPSSACRGHRRGEELRPHGRRPPLSRGQGQRRGACAAAAFPSVKCDMARSSSQHTSHLAGATARSPAGDAEDDHVPEDASDRRLGAGQADHLQHQRGCFWR